MKQSKNGTMEQCNNLKGNKATMEQQNNGTVRM